MICIVRVLSATSCSGITARRDISVIDVVVGQCEPKPFEIFSRELAIRVPVR